MGERKRRQISDPSFGVVPKHFYHGTATANSSAQESEPIELVFLGTMTGSESLALFKNRLSLATQTLILQGEKPNSTFSKIRIGDKDFFEASKEHPDLFLLWLELILFTERLEKNSITINQATRFWEQYWTNAIPILGRLNIKDTQTGHWLSRIKGVMLLVLDELGQNLDFLSRVEFSWFVETKQPFLSMGETMIEVGLQFKANNIIYDGDNLIVFKGTDTAEIRGELMIAVKHASGCWNHYPSSENAHVCLSEYKKAKAELARFPIPLKGELTHPQSSKLAKLFGLTIREKYAYLKVPALR